MLYNALFSLTAIMFCLSLILVYRVRVLERDLYKLQGDISQQLNQQRSEGVHGKLAKMSKTSEVLRISAELIELKHDVCPPLLPAPTSFLQLRAIASKQPDRRGKTNFKNLASALLLSAIILNKCVFPFPPGNITVIPWTVSAQRGNTISQRENRIVVQEDGYYLVFGQVLFESQSTVMGHVIQSWSSTEAETRPVELLRCLQDIKEGAEDNTCYTAGTVHLLRGEELEMVIPVRPSALISLEADSTFFGVIKLN
uniref:Tumor necrosis factor ligand superfamily member 13B-like n=1 Tax=Cyprinodon variegatus TaxID=28743 RepID=A0A3Q2DK80_CYPVA